MFKKMIAVGIVALSVLTIQTISGGEEGKINLIGNWDSGTIEDYGNGTFGWREFRFSDTAWELIYTLYLDKDKAMPVFSFRAVGPYEVNGKSAKVEGAAEAIFRFAQRFVTLKTDNADVIKNFGFGACNLTKDQEKDISETGCSFLPAVKNCAQEYDLVKVAGDTLSLGARPADGGYLCTEDRRPTALGYPLAKIATTK